MHCFLAQKTELTTHSNSCNCGMKSVSDFCHFIGLLHILNMGHYLIWHFTSTLHSLLCMTAGSTALDAMWICCYL